MEESEQRWREVCEKGAEEDAEIYINRLAEFLSLCDNVHLHNV